MKVAGKMRGKNNEERRKRRKKCFEMK